MRSSFLNVGCSFGAAVVALVSFAGFANAQYASEISRWNTQDALDFPAPDGLVFVGSSSIRRWEQLTRDFADYNVIQRGIGGAQFDDVNAQISNLVLKYQPRGVVIWAGTNDLASGSNGNEEFQDYQNFVTTVKATQPDVDIFYLGIMPTPGRQGNLAQENVANSQIAAMAAGDPKQHYIDLPAAFASLNPYGAAEFHNKFADSIHLNRDGYDFWTSVIRPQIAAVLTPDKTYVPNPSTLAVGESLLYDFGPDDRSNGEIVASPDANGNFWNSWRGAVGGGTVNAGEHQANLIDASGNPTGIDLTITAGFQTNGFLTGGLLTPQTPLLGDLAIRNATGDFFFSTADGLQGGGDDDTGGGFMLDGLNPTYEYEFKLFGSRDSTETRVTEYRITGANDQSVLLTTSGNNIGAGGVYDGNDDEVAIIAGVRPDEFGQVFIDLTLKTGSFAYINAMQVTATSANIPEPSTTVLSAAAMIAMGCIRYRMVRRDRAIRSHAAAGRVLVR